MKVYRCLASKAIIGRGSHLFNNNKANSIVGGVDRVILIINLN